MSSKIKILIVDDNIPFCENLVEIVELHDFHAEYIDDGYKAIEAAKNNDFDLVLLDIKMPLINGVETFREIKKAKPKIPVIMMTAFALEDLIKEALQEGVFCVLHKPLDMGKLYSTIEMATQKNTLILVTDDDPLIGISLTKILKEKGYNVKTAKDGKSAIQMTKDSKFDILILDMKLPILNGLETFLAIREIRPYLKTIIISGYSRDKSGAVDLAMEKGAYAFLEKPLNFELLLKYLEEIEKLKA